MVSHERSRTPALWVKFRLIMMRLFLLGGFFVILQVDLAVNCCLRVAFQ